MKKIVVDTRVGSYGVIIRDRKIALIKKARGGYKGLYDLPGGGIEHDETPVETLHRELMEEIGVSIVKAELLDAVSKTFKWDVNDKLIQDLHHIGILYRVEIESDELKTDADGLDSLGGEWIDIDKVKEEDVSPFTWMALKKLGYK